MPRRTRALMIQGTGSDVGKSVVVAGLARAFTRRGLNVRPFKPQNMSNNAGVTADGGEIGRAQMLQAHACGVLPSVHMNPVLLKPQSDRESQIIVQGAVTGRSSPFDYRNRKAELLKPILESFSILSREADLLLIEGAGSPAEVNLRENDVANMGFAIEADVPVVLLGDIERGGVIANLVGTMMLLDERERSLVKACCINKFRGDPGLFDSALDCIRSRAGLACLGVIPWLPQARNLPAEDSANLDDAMPMARSGEKGSGAPIRVVVPRLDRIANHDDLDPLQAEPDVTVTLLQPDDALPGDTDLVILPGSKNTRSDLARLKSHGWHIDIAAHVRRGGWVVGMCGGFQMLGHEVSDPDGVEGDPGTEDGLGLLDISTVLDRSKRLSRVTGEELSTRSSVVGYEIHAGISTGPDCARPMIMLESGPDGAISRSGKVMGTYVHGIFASDRFRYSFLNAIRQRESTAISYQDRIDTALDSIADGIEKATRLDAWYEIAAGY